MNIIKTGNNRLQNCILLILGIAVFGLFHFDAHAQITRSYYNQANDKFRKSDFAGALSYLEKGLAEAERTDDKHYISLFLTNIGVIHWNLGNYHEALSYYKKALTKHREINNRKSEASDLSNIGVVYFELGDYPSSLVYYEQTLRIRRELNDRKGEGNVLTNIGNVYTSLGYYARALDYYERSLNIKRGMGDEAGEGATVNNIGLVYWALGDPDRARSYYEQALKIHEKNEDLRGKGDDLTNIGNVYYDLGDYDKALVFYEDALRIKRDIGAPTAAEEANVGDVYLEQRRYQEAYKIFKRLNYPIRLGKYYIATGDYRNAEEMFSRSLKKNTRDMPNADFLLADYIGLGLSHEGLKDYTKAKEYFLKGIEMIERQRSLLGGAKRRIFLEGKVMGFARIEPYDGMVRVIIKGKERDSVRESFYYAERAKSRIFLEMLASKSIRGKSGRDEAVVEKDKLYQQRLLELKRKMEVIERLESKGPGEQFRRLREEFEKTREEYDGFIKDVKLQNPELASLISVEPVSAEKVQALLDRDITLLEYYSTKNALYAWLLTKKEIKVYEIALKEDEIKDRIDRFLLPNISNRARKAEPVITLAVGEGHKKETTKKEREENMHNFVREAAEIYDLILSPVVKDIKTEQLVIVPHGVLHKVPFSAFNDGEKYMVEKYALSVLPSASVMEFIADKRKAHKDSLLVFANPMTDYVPLGFAESEGEAIAKLFSGSELYSKEKATETMAKNRSSGFNVIHFASHGEFNERQPLQSGLLLARDGENDGFLQVHEIFDMDLKNANLVTLSACETALSKIQGGDDLVGLSRGFIYAGTPSILATLWKVDDASTAALMEDFYRNWKQGISKPEALRRAQIKWMRQSRGNREYSHPFYWAPFEMIGDWR
ncbi:MAG: CHAT domain-containing protein [Nitrospirota bacterium]